MPMTPAGSRVVWSVSLTVALALGTFAFGWYAVPVVAAAWAWIRRGDSAVPVLAALSGAVAWGTLLLIPGVTGGAAAQVADLVGRAMSVGGAALVVLTLAFPALLAGSTAAVVRGVGGER